MELDGYSFDIEANNLYLLSSEIWYIRFTSIDKSRTMQVFPFKEGKERSAAKIQQWIDSFPDGSHVIGWNILGFDTWMLWKFLGIKPQVGKGSKDYLGGKHVQFVDGFVLSMYLNPNSPKHSLEYVSGGEQEEGKIDYRKSLVQAGAMQGNEPKGHEFSFYHDLLIPYCDRDVDTAITEVKKLWRQAQDRYGKDNWIHASFRQNQKDFYLYTAQAYTGVKFNVEKAKALVEHVEQQMQALKQEVDPKLPARQLKTAEQAFYKQPSKPFTKSGELSATMIKWLEKHNAKYSNGVITAYGVEVKLEANAVLPVQLPMEIEDNTELKQYFIDNGWKPHEDFWNFKKGPDGKPLRDSSNKFIKTTPKIQHAGQLCPNLLKLDGDIPQKVVKFLSYRNRLGVVNGWLNNWRIAFDGRLSAEISGYAPTSRVKHKTVVNCPKADVKVLLGAEMRDLFTVDEGNWYCGTDASALENRTLSSYTYKYDDGAFARMQTDGDPHCYSEDTEVLTPTGWKTFGDLTPVDKVAQWDNGQVSFVIPTHIVWQDYVGEMVSVKSQHLDFFVTPNHRVLLKYYKSGNLKVKLASDLTNRNSNERIPVHGKTMSEGINLSNDEIRFIVAVQADAHQSESTFKFEFVKERKIKRMEELLTRLGLAFTIGKGKSVLSGNETKRFSIKRKDVLFTNQGLTSDRKFSNNLLNMSFEQCRVLIKEVQYWDGTLTNKGDVVLDTTCKVSCDLVASICSIAGIKSSRTTYDNRKGQLGACVIQRCYISKESSSYGAGLLTAKIESQPYSGKIGCVSVSSTFILVKRNNKICVSGNTFNAFAFFPELHKKFDINDQTNKDNPEFKPWRNKAKTGAYLLAFGGGAPKLASSLGLSASAGKAAFDNYWESNKGLGLLKKHVEQYFDTVGQKKYIPAIDGRIVSVRGKNVLLSCLGQGCGAIAMSYAACLMDTWLGDMYIDELGRPYYVYEGCVVKRVSMVHDEYSFEVEDGSQEAIQRLSVKAIVKAGELLKLSLPLNGEGKVAYEGSWRDVH